MMQQNSLDFKSAPLEVGVYECEVRLKFRLIEEKLVMTDRDQLLDLLLDAFSCGTDEYLESIDTQVVAQEIDATSASPTMRRQLIRLRNAQIA